jgi:hypothetical protein
MVCFELGQDEKTRAQVENFGPWYPFPHKWPRSPPLGSFSADPNRHRPSLLRTALPVTSPNAASLLPAPDMEELLTDSGNASWAEPDPDDLAFPDRDRVALWSDLSSDGELSEVEAPVPVEWATEEVAAAPAEVEGAVAKEGGAPPDLTPSPDSAAQCLHSTPQCLYLPNSVPGSGLIPGSMPFFTLFLFVKSLPALLIRFVVCGAASYNNLQTSLIFVTGCIFSLFIFTYPGSIWHESRSTLKIIRTSNLQHSFDIGLTSSLGFFFFAQLCHCLVPI